MSINNDSKEMITDDELFNVSGGNKGDAAKDTDPNNSYFSVSKKCVGKYIIPVDCGGPNISWGTITDKRYVNGHWEYQFSHDVGFFNKISKFFNNDWCTADELRTRG